MSTQMRLAKTCGWMLVLVQYVFGLFVPGVFAQAPGQTSNVFKAEDLFRLRSVSEAQISPDGTQIVFEQSAGDIQTDRMLSTLWIVDSTGDHLRPFVAGAANSARWSPDGKEVAYLAADAQGNTQLHVRHLASGSDATITQGTHAPEEIAWSPDGHFLAFSSFLPDPLPTLGPALQKPTGATWAPPLRIISGKHYLADGAGYLPPGHKHLFVVPSAGGEARQITSGSTDDTSPVWSADAASLIYVSENHASRILDFDLQRIFEVALKTGTVRQLSPEPIVASEPVVSPDGRHIAFIGYVWQRPGDFPAIDVYVMGRDGARAHVLAPGLDRVAHAPQWTSDSHSVLTNYADRGEYKIARLGLDGSITALATGVVGQYSASQGGTLAFPLGGSDHPDELGITDKGQVRRLTHLNAPWLEKLSLGMTRPLPVRSSLDGAEVGTWVILPPGYDPKRRYPTILEIHGGPYEEDTPYWRTNSQIFAAAGYVVLYANYRGSTSYGLSFSQAVDRNFPGPAYDDLMSAIDAALSAGIADPARLFVTGGSAGGELTAWIVGKTHRFKAAAAVKPVINLTSQVLENDQYLYGATSLFGATPWTAPMLFWQHSPLSLVAEVCTPTLLMVGEEDRRTPLDQSMEFYNALQIRGVPTGLVIVPGASHESLTNRPSQRAAEDLAILAWFARYGGPVPPATD